MDWKEYMTCLYFILVHFKNNIWPHARNLNGNPEVETVQCYLFLLETKMDGICVIV